MQDVYAQFAYSGRFARVWQTGIRDLIIDFGNYGAILMMLIFGYISGRIYSRAKNEGSLVTYFLLIGINILCVYSVIFTAISDTLVFFYMLISIIMLFYCSVLHKRRVEFNNTTIHRRVYL